MKLTWSVLSDTTNHLIWRGNAHYGEWSVSTIKDPSFFAGELNREVRVSLRLHHETLSDKEVVQRWAEIRETDREEAARLRQHMMSSEIGNFQGWDEAVLAVELLHRGDAHLTLTFDEMLAAMGFTQKYHFNYPDDDRCEGRGDVFMYDGPRKLTMTVVPKEGRADLDLQGSNGHYNLGALHSGIPRVQYPSHITDHRRVFLLWAKKIIDARKQRGGLLRKPVVKEELHAAV